MRNGRAFIAGALVFLAYLPTFRWMVWRWSQPGSEFAHGFLVPLVAAFLIWRKRNIPDAASSGRLPALALIIGGSFLHFAGLYLNVHFLSGIAFVLSAMGLTSYLWGVQALRRHLFALSFLVFMVPVPMFAMFHLSFYLKVIAAKGALLLLRALDVNASLQGSFLELPSARLLIEDACSGVRSLTAFVALGTLFCSFLRISVVKKACFIALLAPLAVAANAVRIFLLSLAAQVYGVESLKGWFHDFSGMLVFVAALAGMKMAAAGLERLQFERAQKPYQMCF